MTVNVDYTQFSFIHLPLSGANACSSVSPGSDTYSCGQGNLAWRSYTGKGRMSQSGGILMSLAPYDRGGQGHLLRPPPAIQGAKLHAVFSGHLCQQNG